ncbi:MAG: YbaB/EbfC family nucleoid-associated protein [Oscillospiraceae bacterium]|jgi:DNA-binding YbaB/EbfC family protein|nr:YbaB/EbfC family nucleoid-associated protein [Oscillospiraceae bacterium]
MAKHNMPSFGGGGNMMRQMQKMQQDVLRMQEELESAEYTASAGGGAVGASVNGKGELLSVTIQKEAAEDTEMLQDLVLSAVRAAQQQASEVTQREMSRLTGGLGLPF